ncbi:MAG: DNA repair protein RadA [Clostridiales bacterium]|nr:DNA repair protein RadA [Clostridiales bacterium]
MAKTKTKFVCSNCGYETGKWLGKCPSCGEFATLNEENVAEDKSRFASRLTFSGSSNQPKILSEISELDSKRVKTGVGELDRVLSGGLVKGSFTLVGGDPGIGKSTLLIQVCRRLGEVGQKILYVSGEESASQVKMRAERLDIKTDRLYILSETSLGIIENAVNEVKPDLVIIDSIQTMYCDEVTSAPGSVSQVRESGYRLLKLAKQNGITVIIVGHVTKDGQLAGPRVLEHMVDTVLYFEGDKNFTGRILRCVKNRFGGTNEIGIFDMTGKGLVEIKNPSEHLLSGRPQNVSGSAVTCSIEGSRPLLLEVQALASYTSFDMPRRIVAGTDFNRVIMLVAVLEKRAGFKLGKFDVYINLTGGIRISEPSLDGAIAAAVASSYRNSPIDPATVIFGEIGLTGELRGVTMCEKRITESAKLGFKNIIIPAANAKEIPKDINANVRYAENINRLLSLIL